MSMVLLRPFFKAVSVTTESIRATAPSQSVASCSGDTAGAPGAMMHQKLILVMFFAFIAIQYIAADESSRFSSGVTRKKQPEKDFVSFIRSPGRRRRPTTGKSKLKDITNQQQGGRDQRLLSLFTVIQFNNQGCAATSGDNGTCLTAAECSERGGTAGGPCANGYGVCCVFFATCGNTIQENCTYFVNPGYPAALDTTGSCQLTLNKIHPDICQYRLEFDQFNIAGPEPVNNVCTNDQFIVSGGSPVNAICGINNGNHMYIDAGVGIATPVTLTFVTSGPSFTRNWKVKICQIPCSTTYRADPGCLQYFTGVSGQIKSFNYDPGSGLQLSNQDYSICIRMERNFCGIQYTACTDTVNNRSHAFTLSGNTQARDALVSSMVSSMGPFPCLNDWLGIPCALNVGRRNASYCVDRICGGTLNAAPTQMVSSIIYSQTKPFRLTFHSDGVEAPDDMGNRGFCLNYIQQPCSNML